MSTTTEFQLTAAEVASLPPLPPMATAELRDTGYNLNRVTDHTLFVIMAHCTPAVGAVASAQLNERHGDCTGLACA